MFIVIDGIDGSGKGTQTQLLKQNLEKLGKKVKILDYPRHHEPTSLFIHHYLNGKYKDAIGYKAASIFYAIDRFDDLFDFQESFEGFDYIISNRYVSANMIHQGSKIQSDKETKEFLEWVSDLEYNIFGIPRPDKTIFLNVDPDTSEKLLQKKDIRGYIKNDTNLDIHEADRNHLRDAHRKAMMICDYFDDWVRIDCVDQGEMRSVEDINADILQEICS